MGRDEFVDWRCRSKCAKLDSKHFDKMFFPPSGRVSNNAKAFCNGCPVLSKCLENALDTNAEGIRAGTTYNERLLMRGVHTGTTGRVARTRTNIVFS